MSEEKQNAGVDLLDSTYPLLQEFRKKCPGTYKHSQTIALMMESVANDLNLDITSMKIRGMYHDIGKILNPYFFSENQGDDNPHDDMSPEMSYEIITRHVSDSVMILINDGNFPRDIIESISRHHGQSLLKHFFNKSDCSNKSDFRYKTSKPRNIEDLILMITDCVEASTRSMSQNGKLSNVSDHIERTVQDLIVDRQFSDVTMKFGDLDIIKDTLKSELGGLYQKRVDYDTDVEETEDK